MLPGDVTWLSVESSVSCGGPTERPRKRRSAHVYVSQSPPVGIELKVMPLHAAMIVGTFANLFHKPRPRSEIAQRTGSWIGTRYFGPEAAVRNMRGQGDKYDVFQ